MDKDTYTSLKKQMESTERFEDRVRWSLPPRHSGAGKKTNKTSSGLPQENIRAIQSERAYSPSGSRTRRHDRARSDDVSERGTDVSDLPHHISSSSVPASSYLPKARRSRTEPERAKWKSVMGTKDNEKREFFPKSVGSDGKLHHGAFVLGNLKSQECTRHNSTEETHVIRRCNFAHGSIGDTLQFVCTMCTSENWKFCKEKVSHKEYIWNLGPYLNSSGEIWKEKDLIMDQVSDKVLEDLSEDAAVLPDGSDFDMDWRPLSYEWGEEVDVNDHDECDRDDEGNEENGAEASDGWMTLGHNRFSALSK